MMDNRALVDNILTRRGVPAANRQRVCSDADVVESLANVIATSLNPDPIDAAYRDYLASQKPSDPSDEEQDEE